MYNYIRILILLLILDIGVVLAESDTGLASAVMATRGKGVVTAEEFDARIAKIPAKDQAAVLRSADRVRTILSNLLLSAQLAADARQVSYEQEVELRMQLAAETELANAWLEHYVESKPDADYAALAREYYLANPEEFQSEPRVDVTHLLVSKDERSAEEAKILAISYLEETRAEPGSFDQLVVQHSDDPSVQSNKGQYPNVKKGDMVLPFERAAFSLKRKGDFSEPVETNYGFHIIRLDRAIPSRKIPFKEVRVKLEEVQKGQHQERVRSDYLRQLSSVPVDVSEEEIRAMVQRYFDNVGIKARSDEAAEVSDAQK